MHVERDLYRKNWWGSKWYKYERDGKNIQREERRISSNQKGTNTLERLNQYNGPLWDTMDSDFGTPPGAQPNPGHSCLEKVYQP